MEDPTVDSYGRRREDGVELRTPIGRIRASGPTVVQIVVLALVTFTNVYFIQLHHENSLTIVKENLDKMAANQRELVATIQAQAEAQAETNYLLTKSFQEREQMNLSMPQSLRSKIQAGQRQ